MATREERKKREHGLQLQQLPTPCLSRIGSFLTTGDCFNAARVSKNNTGYCAILESVTEAIILSEELDSKLMKSFGMISSEKQDLIYGTQATCLAMCPMLKHLEVRERPSPMLDPFLTSRVASSLQSFEIRYQNREDLLTIAQKILPALRSLQTFGMNPSSCYYRKSTRIFDAGLCSDFFAAMPRTLRSLTHYYLDDTCLGPLVNALQNSLPVLEELFLPRLDLFQFDDAEKLGLALSLKKKLRTLLLESYIKKNGPPADERPSQWALVSRVLCLHVQDPENQNYPHLKTLLLGDVAQLAPALLDGRFPALEEVRDVSDLDVRGLVYEPRYRRPWYCTDPATTRTWMDLIHSRQLQVFNADQGINFSPFDGAWQHSGQTRQLMKEFFIGMERPLAPKLRSHLLCINLDVPLDQEARRALLGAIQSHNLASTQELTLTLDDADEISTFADLGPVLDHSFLPALRVLRIASASDHQGLRRLPHWAAFFEAIPAHGLDKLTHFGVGAKEHAYGVVSEIFYALAFLKRHRNVFPNVSCVFLERSCLDVRDLGGISTAIISGVFPSLTFFDLQESEIDYIGAPGAGARLLLSALIHNSKIEKLGLGEWLEIEEASDGDIPAKALFLLLMELFAQYPGSLSRLEVVYLADPCKKLGKFLKAFGGNKPPNLDKIVLWCDGLDDTTEICL